MLPVGLDAPSVAASLSAFRSIARLAALRTRWSAQGDLGSHMSKKSRTNVPTPPEKASFKVGSFFTVCAELIYRADGNIDFAALQHGEPGGGFRDALKNQSLH